MWPCLMFDVWKGLKCDDLDQKTSTITQCVVVKILDGMREVRSKFGNLLNEGNVYGFVCI